MFYLDNYYSTLIRWIFRQHKTVWFTYQLFERGQITFLCRRHELEVKSSATLMVELSIVITVISENETVIFAHKLLMGEMNGSTASTGRKPMNGRHLVRVMVLIWRGTDKSLRM